MKKKLFLIALLAVLSVSFFSSCEKIEQSSPITINDSSTTTAIISGFVYAQLDNTVTGYEFAPSGTKLYFKIDVSQLDMNVGEGERFYIVNGTVGANGAFSVKVPATSKGVDVEILADDFTYDVKTGAATTETKEFELVPIVSSVIQGQSVVEDLYYISF